MKVSRQAIDLFNLSLPALRQVATQLNVEFDPAMTKTDVVLALQELPREVIDSVASDLMYAGNTGITWLQLGDAAVEGTEITEAIEALEGANPFTDELRPESVGPYPQLVEGRWMDGGKAVLTFVVSKRVQTVIHNFELTKVFADHFFQVVLRLRDARVEVRSSHERARMLERTWLRELADLLDRDLAYVPISQEDFNDLKDSLGAVLDVYRGKDTSGSIYDTLELSKSDTCPDLADEDRFLEDIESLRPVSADLIFQHDGSRIRVRVSANGSIWFRTAVSEDVIDTVYAILRKIGAL